MTHTALSEDALPLLLSAIRYREFCTLMSLLAQLINWFRALPLRPSNEQPPAAATEEGSISSPGNLSGRRETAGVAGAEKTIFKSNRAIQKQRATLDALLMRCDVFAEERTQAIKYVEEHRWSAVVALGTATKIVSLADAPDLNGTPHRWPEIQARCEKHLQNRTSPDTHAPKRDKHHVRWAGGRTQIPYTGDPTGHVTDTTDSS